MMPPAVSQEQPHGFGWIPELPDVHDFTLASFPHLMAEAAPVEYHNIRAKQPPIEDQGQTNSCVGHAGARILRLVLRLLGFPDFDGSELFAYYVARLMSGLQTQDQGAYIRDVIKAFVSYGQAPEQAWAWNVSNINKNPPQTAFDAALSNQVIRYVSVPISVSSWKAVLAAGHPIIFGMTVYQNYQNGLADGDWPMPSGPAVGGHALVADGYDPTWCEVANSWGNVGNNGFFRVPWSYIVANASDAWIIELVEGEPIVPPIPVPPAPPTPPAPPAPYTAELDRLRALVSAGQFTRMGWVYSDLSESDKQALRDIVSQL